MTHVIILIKDIEYIISRVEEIEWDINLQLYVKGDIQKLLLGKQISLDEGELIAENEGKLIDLGREIFDSIPNDKSSYVFAVKEGYKQALKDLK